MTKDLDALAGDKLRDSHGYFLHKCAWLDPHGINRRSVGIGRFREGRGAVANEAATAESAVIGNHGIARGGAAIEIGLTTRSINAYRLVIVDRGVGRGGAAGK